MDTIFDALPSPGTSSDPGPLELWLAPPIHGRTRPLRKAPGGNRTIATGRPSASIDKLKYLHMMELDRG